MILTSVPISWIFSKPPIAFLPHCCFSSFSPLDASQVTKLVIKDNTSTCLLDPMPETLVRSCLPILCPIRLDILYYSLVSGLVPSVFKSATVSSILKNPGLDLDVLSNYHPISNLTLSSLKSWKEQSLPNFNNTCLTISSLNPPNLSSEHTTVLRLLL